MKNEGGCLYDDKMARLIIIFCCSPFVNLNKGVIMGLQNKCYFYKKYRGDAIENE